MKNILQKILKHKIIFGIVFIGLVALGLWKFGVFYPKTETRYVLAAVEKGSIVTSISGTGQISPLDEVIIKSKASGDINYIGLSVGGEVSAGKLLLKIDTADAEDAIETAKDNLEQAKIDLAKMQGITTDVGTLRGVKEKAQTNLDKAYEDGFNTVSNVYLGLPTVMSGLQNILLSYTYFGGFWNIDYYVNAVRDYDERIVSYRDDAYAKYQAARTAYDQNFQEYKATSRSSDDATIESLISKSYDAVRSIADAVKSANNLIQFYQDTLTTRGYTPSTLSNTHLSNLSTYTGNTNSYLSSLLSAKTTIQSDKEALIETDYTLADQEKTIANLEKTLAENEDNLSNYSIYAPSAGIISAVNVKKGDSVSSGSTIATLITKQKIAKITLNEVDVAVIKVGQKATLTFDAIEDLTITGKVTEVDTVGTTSQGVVNYTAQILLDTQDDKIKSGNECFGGNNRRFKTRYLVGIKSGNKISNGNSYVEVPTPSSNYDKTKLNNSSSVVLSSAPIQQEVTTGLTDDISTEILTGLKEGDIIVVRTISPSTTATTTTQTGTNRDGVGGVRMPGF